jgi:RNase P/RNase MRP subunit p29
VRKYRTSAIRVKLVSAHTVRFQMRWKDGDIIKIGGQDTTKREDKGKD